MNAEARRPVPVRRGSWFSGCMEERRRAPLQLFSALAAMGDVAAFRAYGLTVYTVNHPEGVRRVLVENSRNYVKGRTLDNLREVLGNGLLTAQGDSWLRNRRLAQPAFHRDRVASMGAMMVEATRSVLDRWSSAAGAGQPVDVHRELMGLTVSVVARALFGADVTRATESTGDAVATVIEEANRRTLSLVPLPLWVPTARNRRFNAARSALDAVVFRIIGGRRVDPGAGDDLLGMLMAARDADTGEAMSDVQLRDEVMTLFLAGHETTANALAWTLHLLAQYPALQDRVRAEGAGALGARPPRIEDLARLPLTLRAFEEALRLYPPAWLIARDSVHEDVVMGYRVPGGCIVLVSVYGLHRSPDLWDNPETFDPDRFLPERSAGRERYAYLPFGVGQRQCIGNTFALTEGHLILATLLQRYRFESLPGDGVATEPLITLRPRGGLLLRVTPA